MSGAPAAYHASTVLYTAPVGRRMRGRHDADGASFRRATLASRARLFPRAHLFLPRATR